MKPATRYLHISLLVTTLVVTIFAELYVSAPESYFGAANNFTTAGIVFAVAAVIATLVASLGLLQNRLWAPKLGRTIVYAYIIAFLPILPYDPTRTIPVIGWFLVTLFRMRERPHQPSKHLNAPPMLYLWSSAHQNAAAFAILIAIAIEGFRLTEHPIGIGLCGFAHIFSAALFSAEYFKTRVSAPRLFWTLTTLLILTLLALPSPPLAISIACLFQLVSLYAVNRRDPMLLGAFDYFLQKPALFIAMTFSLIIAIGTMFLTFPASTTSGSIRNIDALFTAVSAVCVTGLTVLDTGKDFSFFGQAVVLALIQIGGLGIMTLSVAGARIIAGNIGLLAESSFGSLLDVKGARSVYKLLRVIAISTFAIEGLGAAILSLFFRYKGMPWDQALWHGLFHSISAFCNAGFGLETTSLEPYASDFVLLATIMLLIVLGGIGFPTMILVSDFLRAKKRVRLPLQARIILWTTGILILTGWLGFAALEWNGALAHLTTVDKLTNALFQSITLRTAGFNSVPLTSLSGASVAFMILYMFIGGAPGSTAGGIKVTTLSVLLAAVPSYGHGEGTVTIGGRHVTPSTMYRAISVVVVSLITVLTIHFGLLLTEKHSFHAVAFEAVSAVGTVGLSTGITSAMGIYGKLFLILGMFAGRLGPLTLALAFAAKPEKKYKLAHEPVMVG